MKVCTEEREKSIKTHFQPNSYHHAAAHLAQSILLLRREQTPKSLELANYLQPFVCLVEAREAR